MASQDIIQYLEKEQFSAFPGGAAVGVGTDSMNRRRDEVFLAGGTVAVGDIVSLEIAAATDGEDPFQLSNQTLVLLTPLFQLAL